MDCPLRAPAYRELIGVIGIEATVKLARAYGGASLYLPRVPEGALERGSLGLTPEERADLLDRINAGTVDFPPASASELMR
jgi:hypothetical protein